MKDGPLVMKARGGRGAHSGAVIVEIRVETAAGSLTIYRTIRVGSVP